MKLSEHRWVHAIWCDDIRQEVGNKPSFMGVYTDQLVMPMLPAILPRLAVYVSIGTPKSNLFKKLKIRIERSDASESIAAIEVPSEQLEEMSSQIQAQLSDTNGEESGAIGLTFIVQLGAMQLTESTKWFKVWVDTESETLESFKLRINSQVVSEQATELQRLAS